MAKTAALVTYPTPAEILDYVHTQAATRLGELVTAAKNSTDPLSRISPEGMALERALEDLHEVVFSGRVTFDLLAEVAKGLES